MIGIAVVKVISVVAVLKVVVIRVEMVLGSQTVVERNCGRTSGSFGGESCNSVCSKGNIGIILRLLWRKW